MPKQDIKIKKPAINKFANFKDWRIKTKIIAVFSFIVLVSGLISYFSNFYIIKAITDLNHSTNIIHQIIIKEKEIDLEVRSYLFSNELSVSPKIDFINEEDILKQQIEKYKTLANTELSIVTAIEEKSLEFLQIASETVTLHDENIKNLEDLDNLLLEEKVLSSEIWDTIEHSTDSILKEYYALSMYQGKEALFQYRDQKHFIEWKNSFTLLKNEVALSDDAELLEKINIYEGYLNSLSDRIIDIENKKSIEMGKIKELEKIEREISIIQNRINLLTSETQVKMLYLSNIIIIVFILISIILVVIIGYILSNTISRPIKELSDGAMEIAKGNYRKRVPVSSENEIGQTAKAINIILDNLEEKRDVLEIQVIARTNKLQILTNDLENQVEKRTKELKEKISELEKLNDLSVGRELKMLELKEQIKEFKQRDYSDIGNNKETQTMNCWDFLKCNPKIKKKCPAYINNSGRECWKFTPKECHRSKEKGLKDCTICPWYKKVNFETADDITL